MANIHLFDPTEESYKKACDTLSLGGLISFPTETVYGLGADATNGEAVARIFSTKKRPEFNPLIIHLHDIQQIFDYVEIDGISEKLGRHFWPGPFTLILPLKKNSPISPLVSAGLETVAVRIPRNPIAQQLLKKFGRPLAAPSANISGHVSPTTAQHVLQEFFPENGEISSPDLKMIFEGGSCEEGIESTIVQVTDTAVQILRPGTVTPDDIEAVTSHPIEFKTQGQSGADSSKNTLISPGQMKSHYSPNTKMRLNVLEAKAGEGFITFGAKQQEAIITRNLSPNANLHEAAANLFSMIRELDDMMLDTIVVSPIPMHGIGIAINDRLERAAAPKDPKIA